jgi:hypothetical protein
MLPPRVLPKIHLLRCHRLVLSAVLCNHVSQAVHDIDYGAIGHGSLAGVLVDAVTEPACAR